MKNNFINDDSSSGSSIFQAQIREKDLDAAQKLDELRRTLEEFARRSALRAKECENEACDQLDDISFKATQGIKEDEDYFTGNEKILEGFYELFGPLFGEFEVEPRIYEMLKKRKEKNWLASIIKFLRDKLKELIKKIFAHDLSWDERLDKEIKELQEKLASGGLSEEEFARALERLEVLQELKLKLQMAVAGWVVAMFAEIFAIELVAAVEQGSAKEEDKKVKETSSKEASKEVSEDVEVNVGENEKPKLIVPMSLFAIPESNRPVIPLLKPEEQKLLPEPIRNLMPPVHKFDMNKESSEAQKPKVEEKKKEEPKKEAAPEKKPAANTAGLWQRLKDTQRCKGSRRVNKNLDAYRESLFVDNCEFDFANVGTWNGAEHESQQSPMNNAQPTSEFNDVRVTGSQSTGKTPS